MEKAPVREPSYVPRVVAAAAIVVAVLVGVRVDRNIDYSQSTGCPATAEGFNPVEWVAAPLANSLDSQGYQSDDVLARDNCPR